MFTNKAKHSIIFEKPLGEEKNVGAN